MYKNPTTGYYEEDFRRKGVKRLHVSYGVRTQKEAQPASDAMHRIFREKRLELIEKVRGGEISAFQVAATIADEKPLGDLGTAAVSALAWPTLGTAADEYVAWLKSSDKKSKGTVRPARMALDRFLAFAGKDTPVEQITATKVTQYQRHLYDAGYQQNTVVASVWRVSGLFTWLARREKREAQEAKRLPRTLPSPIDTDEITTRHTRRERYLTEAEAERLLAATPPMLLAPIMLGLLAGLRVDEMLHLRPQYDLDLELGLITIQEQPTWHPKNRKRRVVPAAPQLRPVLEYHIATYASEQWLMPSPVFDDRPQSQRHFWDHFQRVVKDAELVYGRDDPNGVVFHTLRHTFASWLVMKGVDLYTVSQLLGNSLKQVEETYAHLAPDFRQRAVDRLAGIVAIPELPSAEEVTA